MIGAFVLAVGLAQAPATIPEMWTEWCARCHAADGSAKIDNPAINVEPLDFSDCSLATSEPDVDWELAIAKGGPAVGLSSQMPAFGDTLTPAQIHGFVELIRGFCREPGWPHGNMNFPRPIFTEKAFPENELVILPITTSRKATMPPGFVPSPPGSPMPAAGRQTDFEFRAIYERRFGRRGMWEVTLPIASHDTSGLARRQGIGDVELAAKYVLAASQARTSIVSAGVEVALPTGSQVRGLGRGTTVFEPYLAGGTMLGNLYLQAQTKIEWPADPEKADREFVYNVYAGRDTSNTPRTWTLGVELNGENEEIALTPQVRKGLTKTGALGAAFGVRLPVTERDEQHTRLVGYLLWEYRDPVRARQ